MTACLSVASFSAPQKRPLTPRSVVLSVRSFVTSMTTKPLLRHLRIGLVTGKVIRREVPRRGKDARPKSFEVNERWECDSH